MLQKLIKVLSKNTNIVCNIVHKYIVHIQILVDTSGYFIYLLDDIHMENITNYLDKHTQCTIHHGYILSANTKNVYIYYNTVHAVINALQLITPKFYKFKLEDGDVGYFESSVVIPQYIHNHKQQYKKTFM